MFFDSLQFSILLPAFLVGMLVIISHIPLGINVLKRGIIFIDIAIAQAAALGVILSNFIFSHFFHYHSILINQLFAFISALLAAIFLHFTDRKFPQLQEGIIGSFFVFCSALVMLILSHNPHGAEDFHNILAGQILWSSFKDVIFLLVIYLPLLFFWFYFGEKIGNLGFYIIFSLIITASVQIIGVYLVFAFLIFPAFIAIDFKSNQNQIIAGYLIANIGFVSGIFISLISDLPTSPLIIINLAMTVVIVKIFQFRK